MNVNENADFKYIVDENEIADNVNNNKDLVSAEERKNAFEFSKKLNDYIQQECESQNKLALELGVATGTLSNYRRGKRFPKTKILIAVAKKMGVSTEYLCGNTNSKKYEIQNINNTLGISENAIINLCKFQQNNFSKNIKMKEVKSSPYQDQLQILSLMIEQGLPFMEFLNLMQQFLNQKIDLKKLKQGIDMNSFEQLCSKTSEVIEIKLIEKELQLQKFYIQEKLSQIIDSIEKDYNKYIFSCLAKEKIKGEENI